MSMENDDIAWRLSKDLVPYDQAVAAMEARVAAIHQGHASEQIWLLQHPPLYTAGTAAKPGDLLCPERFPVYRSGRGGQFTYHGPGQRIAYVMLDLSRRGRDVRRFVQALEGWVIAALSDFGIQGQVRPERVGVWVTTPAGEKKIAAIGVRVRRWVSFHGLAINVDPDLSHFSGIVPCGIAEYGVTSLAALGIAATLQDVDQALRAHLPWSDPVIEAGRTQVARVPA